jgi:hypothetical protein
VAAASTADESRPPEKLTTQGGRSSARRTAWSNASNGCIAVAGSDGAAASIPIGTPQASSSGVRSPSVAPWWSSLIQQAELFESLHESIDVDGYAGFQVTASIPVGLDVEDCADGQY